MITRCGLLVTTGTTTRARRLSLQGMLECHADALLGFFLANPGACVLMQTTGSALTHSDRCGAYAAPEVAPC